jgi:hypothetical protein
MPTMKTLALLAVVLGTVVSELAPSAAAADWVANEATQIHVSADAAGDLGVSWAAAGTRNELVDPAHGQVYHGALPGPDVSRAAPSAGLPFGAVVRRTPGGWLVAAQMWSTAAGPRSLHISRWKGAPPVLTLSAQGARLTGRATFEGKPVPRYSPTPAGRQQRLYVYIDCFGCPGAPHGWSSMLGISPRVDGTFATGLRASWRGSRYRAALEGPNIGATRAPDVQAFAVAR